VAGTTGPGWGSGNS